MIDLPASGKGEHLQTFPNRAHNLLLLLLVPPPQSGCAHGSPQSLVLRKEAVSCGPPWWAPLTFIFEMLKDGDDGLQWDVVGQEELPGAVLLKGLPLQALDWRMARGGGDTKTHKRSRRSDNAI